MKVKFIQSKSVETMNKEVEGLNVNRVETITGDSKNSIHAVYYTESKKEK